MTNFSSYTFVYLTIILSVYSQLILKYRMLHVGTLPEGIGAKLLFGLGLFLDPLVLSAMLATSLAAVCWMAAMTKLPLSVAYPYLGLCFVLVTVFGHWFFNEQVSIVRIIGLALIIFGIIVGSKG